MTQREPVNERDGLPALLQSWPPFLNHLDSHPSKAMDGFYVFMVKLLETKPPAILRRESQDRREDFYHEFFLHCCDNDFAKLRRYVDRGRPFSGWLLTLATNLAIDRKRATRETPTENIEILASTKQDQTHDSLQDKRVRECLDALGDPCAALLLGWAVNEMSLDDLRTLLAYPPGAASVKKTWDQVHKKCKPKLLKCLKQKGLAA